QLSLGLLYLIVQSPQDMPRGVAVVVLDELQVEPRCGELALLPGLHEVAARIAEHFRADQHDLGDVGRDEFHVRPALSGFRADRCRIRSWRAAAPVTPTARRKCSSCGRRSPPGSR